MENVYLRTVTELTPQIQRVREALRQGGRASVEANRLHAEGLGNLRVMVVFMEAPGIGPGEAKLLGQWWGEQGVTDADSFDAYAAELMLNEKADSRCER